MVNGGRVVELDERLAASLSAAAASAGKPALDCAASLISDGLDDDWVEDDRRFAEYERTGVSFNVIPTQRKSFFGALFAFFALHLYP